MRRPEEQIQRAVVSHLKARSMPGIVKYGKTTACALTRGWRALP